MNEYEIFSTPAVPIVALFQQEALALWGRELEGADDEATALLSHRHGKLGEGGEVVEAVDETGAALGLLPRTVR